jgi:RND family efflux transporter MFP subunit
MTTPASPSTSATASAVAAAEPATPDAPRLQGQLAALAESTGQVRPLLEFLRVLLNARAVALLPCSNREGLASCVVTTRGVLASSLQAFAEKLDPREAVVQPEGDHCTLAVPVRHEGTPLWWLLAQLAVPNPRDLPAFLVLLQTVAGYLLYREQRLITTRAEWALAQTSGVLEIIRRAGAELDFEKAIRLAVDDLAQFLGGAQVVLTLRTRGALHVRAISGHAQIDPKSPAHQPWEAAAAEALAHGTRAEFPGTDFPAQELLAAGLGAARVITLPLARQRGAVSLAWSSAPDEDAARVTRATEPFITQLFELLVRARPAPLVFAVQRAWQRLTARRRRALLCAAGALALLLAFPFRYEIKAECRLAPKVKRVVAAPFAGELRQSTLQPGDAVRAGDVLVEMEERELKLRAAELAAARDRALKQRDRALRNEGEGADFAAAQVADFEARSVGEELALVERKLALLQVRAPIDGVIVAGDLRRAAGQPVPAGQLLFEIAPLDALLVEIDVPDREVSRVRPGQRVKVRLEAFGGQRWRSTLERIHPQSEQREGKNVFIAEAPLDRDATPAELRPGMKGRAAIATDRRPLLWILGHKFWDWLVTTLFW